MCAEGAALMRRRTLLITAGVVVSAAVAAALLLAGARYLLHDETFLKRQATAAVSRATGRRLLIEGPLRLELGRVTTIEAGGLVLSNAPWADEPDMARIGLLRLSLDFPGMFQGRLDIKTLEIAGCQINLAKNADGDVNWKPQDESSSADPGRGWAVRLAHLRARDCRVTHTAPERQQPLQIELAEVTLDLGEEQRYRARAAGAIDDHPLRLEGQFGPLEALLQNGRVEHDLSLQAGDIVLTSRGSIMEPRSGSGANLAVQFSGPEFAVVSEFLAWPAVSRGAFNFRGSLNSEGSLTTIDVAGDFGQLQLKAAGQLDRLIYPTTGSLAMDLAGPDLDAVGQTLGVTGLLADTFRLTAQARFEDGRTTLAPLRIETEHDSLEVSGELGAWPALADSVLQIQARAADLGRWSGSIGGNPVTLPGFQADAQWRVDAQGIQALQLAASQGETDFGFEGLLGPVGGKWQPQGAIAFQSPDASGFARLLGFEDWPAAPVELATSFGLDDEGLHLSRMQLTMAGNLLKLEGVVTAATHWAGSRLDGRLDVPDTAALGRLLGAANLPGEPLAITFEVHPTGNGNGLSVRIDDGSVGSWRIGLDGVIDDSRALRGIRTQFELSLPSLRLAKRLASKVALPDLPVAISGRLHSEGAAVRLDETRLQLGSTRLELDGTIDLRAGLIGTRLHVTGAGDDWTDWVSAPPGSALPRDFTLAADWALAADAHTLHDLQLNLGKYALHARGRIGRSGATSPLDLGLRVSGPDLAALHARLGEVLGAEAFVASARVLGSLQTFELLDLDAQLGASRVAGMLKIERGDPLRISGEVTSQMLDLDRWLAREQQQDAPTGPVPTHIFDDTPVMQFARDDLQLDLLVRVAQADLGNAQLRDLELGVFLDEQELRLDPINLRDQWGASVTGRLAIGAAAGLPRLRASLAGQNVRLGLAAAPGQPLEAYPPMDITLLLDGAGATQHTLVASLNGTIRAYLGRGRIIRIKTGPDEFLTKLFAVLNPFAARSQFTEMDCGVLAADIVNGRVALEPIVIRTRELTILSQGSVDLNSEKLDLQFQTKPRTGIGVSTSTLIRPFVRVGGTLATPALELDPKGAVMSGGAAVVTAGLSILAQSLSDRFLSSPDPCGEARRKLASRDAPSR